MIKTELAKVAKQLELTYSSKDKVMFGQYKSYKIAVKEDIKGHRYYFSFPIKPSKLSQNESMDTFIHELLQDTKTIKAAVYEDYSLTVEVAMKAMAKNNISSVIELLDKMINFAKQNLYEACCSTCGEKSNISSYLINEALVHNCEKCYNETIQDLDDIQLSIKNRKGSFVTGLVGAILGSLIGVVLWVVVYAIGYIAAICGVVLAVCIIKGYELLGGKLNALGIITTALLTIFMVYVATYLSYGYEVYAALKNTENIDIFQGIRLVKPFLNEYEEVKRSFIGDLALGYLLTSIGAISTFISAYKRSNFKYKTKKLVVNEAA